VCIPHPESRTSREATSSRAREPTYSSPKPRRSLPLSRTRAEIPPATPSALGTPGQPPGAGKFKTLAKLTLTQAPLTLTQAPLTLTQVTQRKGEWYLGKGEWCLGKGEWCLGKGEFSQGFEAFRG